MKIPYTVFSDLCSVTGQMDAGFLDNQNDTREKNSWSSQKQALTIYPNNVAVVRSSRECEVLHLLKLFRRILPPTQTHVLCETASPGLTAREICHTEISDWWSIAVVNIRNLTTDTYVISVLQKKCVLLELCLLKEGKVELQRYELPFICLSKPVTGKPSRIGLRMARVFQHT